MTFNTSKEYYDYMGEHSTYTVLAVLSGRKEYCTEDFAVALNNEPYGLKSLVMLSLLKAGLNVDDYTVRTKYASNKERRVEIYSKTTHTEYEFHINPFNEVILLDVHTENEGTLLLNAINNQFSSNN